MSKIEDTSIIYYTNGKKVQDGQEWLDEYKHGEIEKEELSRLQECYWSALCQCWMTND